MFHYRFDCRLDSRPHGNVKFVVEGNAAQREDCTAIHNALLGSPNIVVQGAYIAPVPVDTAITQ